MHRRAYVLLISIALVTGSLALIAATALDEKIRDPDGFLGPAMFRFPILIGGALLLDMLPRTLWGSRLHPKLMWPIVVDRWRSHWNRERLTLVILGVTSFYITYVGYRNLKSYLPKIRGLDADYDRSLHLLDRAVFFGHEPAAVLHGLLGTTITAHALSYVYLWFLPMVPLGLTAWMIWSRNISFGYWFATSQCLAWALGTASYYMLPTTGPGFEYAWLYQDLDHTNTTKLMDTLSDGRRHVLWQTGFEGVQSVAGFASLHVAITLLLALMVQYTIKARWAHWLCWTNLVLTVTATLYFGWHYVADDVAGAVIAIVAFYIGGLASGQKFDRHGLSSHPTTTTSIVPVRKGP